MSQNNVFDIFFNKVKNHNIIIPQLYNKYEDKNLIKYEFNNPSSGCANYECIYNKVIKTFEIQINDHQPNFNKFIDNYDFIENNSHIVYNDDTLNYEYYAIASYYAKVIIIAITGISSIEYDNIML